MAAGRVISLFAGIGGFDLGFERAGFETVAVVEKDEKCREQLHRKWPNAAALDLLTASLIDAGFGPAAPVCAMSLAKAAGVDLAGRDGTSFSPASDTLFSRFSAGCDFLTWLWWRSEEGGGRFATPAFPEIAALVEGPLVFRGEDSNGAKTCRVAEGCPQISAEAKAALMGGKQLRSARVTLAADSETVFEFAFDADDFAVRSLAVPKSEALLTADERLAERLEMLDLWFEIVRSLFGEFLKAYAEEDAWRRESVPQIREWVQSRPGRA